QRQPEHRQPDEVQAPVGGGREAEQRRPGHDAGLVAPHRRQGEQPPLAGGAEGQRDDREVHAPQPQRRDPQRQADRRPQQRHRRQRHDERDAAVQQSLADVDAEAEEGGVAERDLARPARQHDERQGDEGVDGGQRAVEVRGAGQEERPPDGGHGQRRPPRPPQSAPLRHRLQYSDTDSSAAAWLGRKASSTASSVAKTMTSPTPGVDTYPWASEKATPTARLPTTASRRLLNPPSTAATRLEMSTNVRLICSSVLRWM